MTNESVPVLVTDRYEVAEQCVRNGDLFGTTGESLAEFARTCDIEQFGYIAAKLGSLLLRGADYWEAIPVAVWNVMPAELRVAPEKPTPDFGAGTVGDPRYPDVTVKLVGIDGNAFVIMGAVTKGIAQYYREGGYGGLAEELAAFGVEATSGDYDGVIQTAMRWVNVE